MSASCLNPLSLAGLYPAPPYGIWEDSDALSLWQDNEYGPTRPLADLPTPAGSVHSQPQSEQRISPVLDNESTTMETQRPIMSLKRKYSTDSYWPRDTKRARTNSDPCLPIRPQAYEDPTSGAAVPEDSTAEHMLSHAHPKQHPEQTMNSAVEASKALEPIQDMPPSYPLPQLSTTGTPPPDSSDSSTEKASQQPNTVSLLGSDSQLVDASTSSSTTPHSELAHVKADGNPQPAQLLPNTYTSDKGAFALPSTDQDTSIPTPMQSVSTPETMPTCGAEMSSDESELSSAPATEQSDTSETHITHEVPQPPPEPYSISADDQKYIKQVKAALLAQSKWKTMNVARRQAGRIHELLEIARYPDTSEALITSVDEAAKHLEGGKYFPGPIITGGGQQLPLQTTQQFLDEFYDDKTKVWIQDPGVRLAKNIPFAREIDIGLLKKRFPNKRTNVPWNCLEMATFVEDGLRPAFLNSEDCRLLTKLKIPTSGDTASRRGYDPGWKEVEKWALLAQGGALTEPHQDSHGYSTYITMNQGTAGFGWLSNPTPEERMGWRHDPATYTGGRWRYVVLRPGQTVFFPSGTVHFVFRLKATGDTLAFGGHVLRCSQIVRWVEAMLEEKAGADITNEDLTVSAPAYLDRVERFVKQAIKDGKEDKWGGKKAVERFLQLKTEFERPRKEVMG